MKLNIGAGFQKAPDFLSVDLHTDADLTFDISQPWPLEDDSVEEIVSYHVYEHISYRDEETLWNETFRVLAPDGKLCVEVPDAEKIMQLFLHGNHAFSFEMCNINGAIFSWGEPMRYLLGHQDVAGQDHRSFYTTPKFKRIAELLGFSEYIVLCMVTGNMPCLQLRAVK